LRDAGARPPTFRRSQVVRGDTVGVAEQVVPDTRFAGEARLFRSALAKEKAVTSLEAQYQGACLMRRPPTGAILRA
jgi:hypothetical protein